MENNAISFVSKMDLSSVIEHLESDTRINEL